MRRSIIARILFLTLILGSSILPPAAWAQSQVPSVEKMGPDSVTSYLFDDLGIKAYLMYSPAALGAGLGSSILVDFSVATLDLGRVPDSLAKRYKSGGVARVLRFGIYQALVEGRREVLESLGKPLVLYLRAGSVDAGKDAELGELFVCPLPAINKADADKGWLRVKDLVDPKATGDFLIGNFARTPDKRYYRIEFKEWPKGGILVDGA
jgi:hypothetical protein